MRDLAALALSGQYQIIGLTLRTLGSGCQVQHAVLQLGKHGVCGAVEGIAVAHLVAVSFGKYIAHLQLIQTAGLCSSCSRRITFYRQTGILCSYKQDQEGSGICFGVLYGNSVQFSIAIRIPNRNSVLRAGCPTTLSQVSAIRGVISPLHILLKEQGSLSSFIRDNHSVDRQVCITSHHKVRPLDHVFCDLGHFLVTYGDSKRDPHNRKHACGEHSQHHDHSQEQGKKSFLHKRNLLIKIVYRFVRKERLKGFSRPSLMRRFPAIIRFRLSCAKRHSL